MSELLACCFVSVYHLVLGRVGDLLGGARLVFRGRDLGLHELARAVVDLAVLRLLQRREHADRSREEQADQDEQVDGHREEPLLHGREVHARRQRDGRLQGLARVAALLGPI